MKESYRLTEMKLPEGYDFIFIARNTIANAKCAEVKNLCNPRLEEPG